MIIEAGFDVLCLLDASVNKNSRSKRALWMLAADEYLRFVSLSEIVRNMVLPVEAYIDEVSSALRQSPLPVKYVALAYTANELSGTKPRLDRLDDRLTADGWLGDVELLGQVVFDASGYVSTVPRFSFRDYIGLEHLPRSVSVLGPHDVGCECVACVQFEQMLLDNRKKSEVRSA